MIDIRHHRWHPPQTHCTHWSRGVHTPHHRITEVHYLKTGTRAPWKGGNKREKRYRDHPKKHSGEGEWDEMEGAKPVPCYHLQRWCLLSYHLFSLSLVHSPLHMVCESDNCIVQ